MGMQLTIKELYCGTTSTGVSGGWVNLCDGFMGALFGAIGAGLGAAGGAALGAGSGASAGAAAGAAMGATTGPAAVLLVPVGAAAGGTVGASTGAIVGGIAGGIVGGTAGATFGTALAEVAAHYEKKLGQSMADEVYIQVNGSKVWPTNAKYLSMKGGASQVINDVNPFPLQSDTQLLVELFDWDITPGDTPLGKMLFTTASQSGLYAFTNSNQGSIYFMTVLIQEG